MEYTSQITQTYVHCCKNYDFPAEQCSLLEATVYKRHGFQEFEGTTRNVAHCDFAMGSCELEDGSKLVWEVKEEATACQYEEWLEIEVPDFLQGTGCHIQSQRDVHLATSN